MKIALVGNPNSGKTTLFNSLTRQNQKVGNWSGVTVEQKTGKYFKDKSIEIVDLPGVYSLNPITADERVTVKYLKNETPDLIIQIIDGTVLERSLALTLQLLEKNVPLVLAVNMQEELKKTGVEIDVEKMREEFGVPCVLISARKNKSVHILMEHVVKEMAMTVPLQFLCEGATEEERAEYRHKIIAERVQKFKTTTEIKRHNLTAKIDRIVLNKFTAFPIFFSVVWLMYFLSVQSVGAIFGGGLNFLFFDVLGESIRNALVVIGSPAWVVSLTVDGVVAGVGAVLTFIPQIVMLFIFITFLEGCGYMARVAVIMDRLFKRLGLSGKSFIPMIVGCGCSVPAILSAKTVDGEKEKRNTILLTPFIPCSAKLPVFALFAGALFPENAFVAPGMYFLGIFMVVIGALFLKIFNRGERNREMLIIELPHYRLPAARNVVREIWDKTRGFIVRAGVIIVPAAIVLWVLQSFSFSFRPTGVDQSMLAQIGRVFAWILVPLGFGNWQSAIAYLSGIVAKETVVATYGVVLGGDVAAGLATIFTPTSAFAFMAFTLLSAPCIAAIAATKNELGVRGMWIAILFQCGTAWVVAFLINQFGNLVAFHRTAAISAVAIAAIIAVFAVAIWYFVRKKSPCGGGCGNCRKKNDCENEKK